MERRNRRNYAFDNYRQNRNNQRNRNVDEFFNRNFGGGNMMRRNRRDSNQMQSSGKRNAPLALRAPRTSNLRRNDNNNNNNNNNRRNNNRNTMANNNNGQGRSGRGRMVLGNRRNNNNNSNGNNNNPIRSRGNNQQRRRNQNQNNLLNNNQGKIGTRVRRVLRRNAGPVGKLDLSNLSPDIINKDLIEVFSVYGRLKRCAVLFQENQSTGRGVVQYESRANAQRAFHDLQGTCIKGSYVNINLVGKKKKESKALENNNNNTGDVNMTN